MNKEIFNQSFTKEAVPEYLCPHCCSGVLRVDGEFFSHEPKASAALHSEDWWEVDHVELFFKCTLKCSSCADLVFVVGSGSVSEVYDEAPDGEWHRDYIEYYRPSFFHPPLQLVSYPAKAPENVVSPLDVAGALFFSSPSSCCNSIRASAEEVLTHLGVEVREADDRFIPFAKRIKLLGPEQESIKHLFDAIRWLGNHGSHPGNEVEQEDALHALEIMEFLLEEVYGSRKQDIAALAAAINASKGPVGKFFKPGNPA